MRPIAKPPTGQPMKYQPGMNVHMDEGAHWILVIDTDAFAGNFEHELAAYVTGFTYETPRGKDFARDARNADPMLAHRVSEKCTIVQDLEFGEVIVAIRATPGRVNDGMGNTMDSDSGVKRLKTMWPAYESIAIFLSEPLDSEEMAFVKDRAGRFLTDAELTCKPTQIRDVYLVKHTIPPACEERQDV